MLVNRWFWSNNGHFSNFLFLDNVAQENVFYDILERKNGCLGYKNKGFKKSKNLHFSNRVNHGLGPKMAIFRTFFLGIIGQENVFYDILQRKIAFLRYKNIKFKKSKIDIFPWFCSKNGHFSNFFFKGNIGRENVVYDILQRKNAFLGYKNKKFKKSKNWHFSKEVNPWFLSKNGHFFKFFFRQYRPGKSLLIYSRTKKRFSRL